MFSIPPVARGEKPHWGIRLAAASGLAMTLLFIALSIFTIVTVKSNASFAAELSGIVIAINAAGALYYWRARKRKGTLPIPF
jgi:hypothetical protein